MLKKTLLSLFIPIMIMFLISESLAKEGNKYAGIKTGLILIDESGVENINSLGVIYGQSLKQIFPNLWIEGELNFGIAGGDWDAEPFPGTSVDADYDIWTAAVYGVYRYPLGKAAYLKGKAGLLFESIDAKYSYSSPALSAEVDNGGNNTAFSAGIGGGYQIYNNFVIEAEFTMMEPDINYLSVGVNHRF